MAQPIHRRKRISLGPTSEKIAVLFCEELFLKVTIRLDLYYIREAFIFDIKVAYSSLQRPTLKWSLDRKLEIIISFVNFD